MKNIAEKTSQTIPVQDRTPASRESVSGVGISPMGYFPAKELRYDPEVLSRKLLFPFNMPEQPEWWKKMLNRRKKIQPTL